MLARTIDIIAQLSNAGMAAFVMTKAMHAKPFTGSIWHHGGITVLACDAKNGVFGTIPEM